MAPIHHHQVPLQHHHPHHPQIHHAVPVSLPNPMMAPMNHSSMVDAINGNSHHHRHMPPETFKPVAPPALPVAAVEVPKVHHQAPIDLHQVPIVNGSKSNGGHVPMTANAAPRPAPVVAAPVTLPPAPTPVMPSSAPVSQPKQPSPVKIPEPEKPKAAPPAAVVPSVVPETTVNGTNEPPPAAPVLVAVVPVPKAAKQPISTGKSPRKKFKESTAAANNNLAPAVSVEQTQKRKKKNVEAPEPDEDDGSEPRISKRVRLQHQPFQSPALKPQAFMPQTFCATRSSATVKSQKEPKGDKSSVSGPEDAGSGSEEKVVVFSRNEFLAVRNESNGFYVCRTAQNVYKSSRKFKIQWLNDDVKDQSYTPDFFDVTDFECVLTNLRMTRVAKNKFKLPEDEKKRAENILQRAINVERGVTTVPDPIQVAADGIDVSVVGGSQEEVVLKTLKESVKQNQKESKAEVAKESAQKSKKNKAKAEVTKSASRRSSTSESVSSKSNRENSVKNKKAEDKKVEKKTNKKLAEKKKKLVKEVAKKSIEKTPPPAKSSKSKAAEPEVKSKKKVEKKSKKVPSPKVLKSPQVIKSPKVKRSAASVAAAKINISAREDRYDTLLVTKASLKIPTDAVSKKSRKRNESSSSATRGSRTQEKKTPKEVSPVGKKAAKSTPPPPAKEEKRKNVPTVAEKKSNQMASKLLIEEKKSGKIPKTDKKAKKEKKNQDKSEKVAAIVLNPQTPLEMAIISGKFEIAESLIRAESPLKSNDGNSLLFTAISSSAPMSTINLMIKKGASVKEQEISTKQNVLHKFAQVKRGSSNMGEQFKVLDLLIDSGAEINALDKGGNTPLKLAIDTATSETDIISADASIQCVKKLIERGADQNIRISNGGKATAFFVYKEIRLIN